jgi:hypothetical protein
MVFVLDPSLLVAKTAVLVLMAGIEEAIRASNNTLFVQSSRENRSITGYNIDVCE